MILSSTRLSRGVFFNTWHDRRRALLVKSFSRSSPHFIDTVHGASGDALVMPLSLRGARRHRYVYEMKPHFTRLVETDISAITPEFGLSLVEAYKKASQQIEKLEGRSLSAPQFCRYQGEAGLTSVLAECLSGNTDALGRLHSASSSIDRSLAVVALHGTFSVANILANQSSNRARIIYDNGSFIGPVEYDLATLIETFVDLANKKRLTGQDSGAVDRFLSTLVSAFESEFKMDRQALRDITLYQYVGHINMFQTLCLHASRPLVPSSTYAKLIATFIRTMDELI